MPTVHEILKQSGLDDAQIASLDSKIMAGLGKTLEAAEAERQAGTDALTKAEAEKKAAADQLAKAQQDFEAAKAAKEQAERERLSNVEFYEQRITPALTGWEQAKKDLEIAKANAEAKAVFYEKQIEGAKASGFIAIDAPAFVLPSNPNPNPDPARGSDGRFVSNAPGATPGSPSFLTPAQMAAQAGDQLAMLSDVQFEYQKLYGAPMPMLPSQLVAEAEKFRLDPKSFAEKQFKFGERRQELAAKAKAEEHAQIAADAVKPLQEQFEAEKKAIREAAEKEKRDLLERFSSNPDVRIGQPSNYADLSRAVKANSAPDPLALNPGQRHMATRNAIHKEVAEQAAQ